MRRLFKPALFILVMLYFTVDAVFMNIAQPVANWLAKRKLMKRLQIWIVSLRPYPTLALFAAPLIVLEPIKPLAAYLIGTGRFSLGTAIFVIGEILKLVLVERLFNINRDKLLSIPIFAWAHNHWRRLIDLLQSTEIWRNARRAMAIARLFARTALRSLMPLIRRHTCVQNIKIRNHYLVQTLSNQ